MEHIDPEQVLELAVAYAGEGLEGQMVTRFEEWRTAAGAGELRLFADLVDALAVLTLVKVPAASPSAGVKNKVMEAITGGEGESALLPDESAFSYLLKNEGAWVQLPVPGARVKELSSRKEDGVTVFLLEMDAQCRFPAHHHHGVEMAYVLTGDLQTGGKTLHAGDFMRAGADTEHSGLYSEGGCQALLITATDNFPRRTVGAMRKLQALARTVLDLFGGKKD